MHPHDASFRHKIMKTFRKITGSISFKLFVVLVGTLTIVSIIFTVSIVNTQTRQMMAVELHNANATADLIRSSIHHSMLVNRKEDAYRIIHSITDESHVLKIRLYNKQGVITYSTASEEEKVQVDLMADACIICHDTTPPLVAIPYESRWRIIGESGAPRILELTTPIENEHSCSQSGCHPSPETVSILGILDVLISLQQVDASIAESRSRMVVSSIFLIVAVSSAFGLLLRILVGRPVRKMKEGTKQIASGNLAYEIPYNSGDELGDLARSFNKMTTELRSAHNEIKQWSQTLEVKVRLKTEELKKTQSQLIQIEKMASLGKLSASVAHELNNPLEGILTYAKLIAKRIRKQEQIDERTQDILNDLDLIVTETSRCGTIVKNLLLFSRKQVGDFETFSINSIIEKTVRLVEHHLRISKVELETAYSSNDMKLYCNPNQIQQAILAICVNAVEAMPNGGTLKITAGRDETAGTIRVKISDTGMGIAPEDIPHIFEPFFTRKTEGKGVGLGLSIVYGIVERHGGEIDVESKVGEGTVFTLTLPQTERKIREES